MAGTWIEVDLDAVAGNYREIVRHLRPQARCMAVVKADAYGLGAVQVALALERTGCEAFAVTKVEEGLILREHGIKGAILVLGPSTAEEWPKAMEAQLHLTLSELSAITEINEVCLDLEQEVSVHIKLETGMGRTGFRFSELEALAHNLAAARQLKVMGVYTHFARAAQKDKSYTSEQYELFKSYTAKLEELGIHPLWKHVCNSAAFLDYPEWHHDFVRIGTLLIGHYPGPGFSGKLTLADPWIAKSKIVHLRKVPKGTYVGYQSIYCTKEETQLAVIPVGYADGLGIAPHFVPQGWVDFLKIIIKNFAALFGIFLSQERVELRGRTVRVAGKIGMQLTVIDVGLQECTLGDEVKIPLRRTLANPRIHRKYKQDGRIFAERIMEEGVSAIYPEYS
ncbi:alanine racemase [Desulfosporosinus orientis DSM 765]|uniref:Alanine racemase n=1 Tax=Desulfosporosinus orientis (strain ATCC 19365 / DSM 765 / NCIMB 8382 / VKM B-1628 / Singapore I) TaxID=768706 RepID=G7WHJ9_DESOD|nr:alanine racemase [Desulfosporosinus orientis]AET70920.1 alanine racemase [Desulfosporosinus orientis DSM 765]